jgi:hypothetical protein
VSHKQADEHTALRSGLVIAIGICATVVLFSRGRRGMAAGAFLIGALALIVLITDFVLARRRARAAKRRRRTPWTDFMEPAMRNGKSMWRIGIRRKTEDGEVLDTDEENDVFTELGDSIARITAQGEAQMRAAQYNDEEVRM